MLNSSCFASLVNATVVVADVSDLALSSSLVSITLSLASTCDFRNRPIKEQRYQLFILRDADPHGYNIARTLAGETARMPEHSVEVIDLGFKLEEAIKLGLLTETFTRKNALPSGLKLNDLERAYFTGTPSGKSWICERVELNALRPSQRLEYAERKLKEHGATAKIIPPVPVLTQTARTEA